MTLQELRHELFTVTQEIRQLTGDRVKLMDRKRELIVEIFKKDQCVDVGTQLWFNDLPVVVKEISAAHGSPVVHVQDQKGQVYQVEPWDKLREGSKSIFIK